MLRTENIRKTYKSKDGECCTAVDGVSIDFGDKGFVFVVGKSGSGKSTLLNLLSGLDTADSGDIIIAGKSTAEFTQSDFDIYRNTYVGFVFQDFSLMDELTVRENISIGAKLQGRIVTDDEVKTVLALVELGDKQHRKIKELSGGQKQRVAIARALIKSPKIIFADEPTGALDADTGKHIFELLRELSKDRLVIAVSHDKDSAIIYGDRIIELKDGKVITDRTKTNEVDLAALKKEFENKINKNFTKTKTDKKESTQTFERTVTHLPLKEAVKIGITNFKQKWLSFTITTLLTVFALGGFALSFILNSYNPVNAQNLTYDDLNINTILVTNTREKTEEELDETDNSLQTIDNSTHIATVFNTARLNSITDKYNGVHKVYNLSGQEITITGVGDNSVFTRRNRYYDNKIKLFVEFAPTDKLDNFYHSKILCGSMPNANLNAVEIAVSDYTAESIMQNGGVFYNNETVYPNTGYENIINKVIDYNGIPLKIVGIFATDYRTVLYDGDTLKDDRDFRMKFNLENIYQTAIISNGALQAQLNKTELLPVNAVFVNGDNIYDQQITVKGITTVGAAFAEYGLTVSPFLIQFADGYDENMVLGDNEIVIDLGLLRTICDAIFNINNNIPNFADLTNADFENLTYNIFVNSEENEPAITNAKIVGILNSQVVIESIGALLPEEQRETAIAFTRITLMNQTAKDNLVSGGLIVANLFMELPANQKVQKSLLSFLYDNNYEVLTYATTELKTIQTMFTLVTDILTYISIALCVFVIILLYNFIAGSIHNKTKEIGILRSLGARGIDIAKVFGFEGGIIALANVLLSFVLILIGVPLFNNAITKKFPTHITIVSVTPLSVILTALLCAGITAVSCIIPLLRLTKMRPTDVIRRAE